MHPVAGEQQAVMLGQCNLVMVEPQAVLQPQGAQQDVATVGVRMGVVAGDLAQMPPAHAIAQQPCPTVAHMEDMGPPPAQHDGREGAGGMGHALPAPLRGQPAVIGRHHAVDGRWHANRIALRVIALNQRAHGQFCRHTPAFAPAHPIGQRRHHAALRPLGLGAKIVGARALLAGDANAGPQSAFFAHDFCLSRVHTRWDTLAMPPVKRLKHTIGAFAHA
jgi:hypothetical protein